MYEKKEMRTKASVTNGALAIPFLVIKNIDNLSSIIHLVEVTFLEFSKKAKCTFVLDVHRMFPRLTVF